MTDAEKLETVTKALHRIMEHTRVKDMSKEINDPGVAATVIMLVRSIENMGAIKNEVIRLFDDLELEKKKVEASPDLEDGKDVHTEHCCMKHGCKYHEGDNPECTVLNGKGKQSRPCEDCYEEEEEKKHWEKVEYEKSCLPHGTRRCEICRGHRKAKALLEEGKATVVDMANLVEKWWKESGTSESVEDLIKYLKRGGGRNEKD